RAQLREGHGERGEVFRGAVPRACRRRRGLAAARRGRRDRRGDAPGVTANPASSALAARLEKLAIRSKLDLALHLPLRYEDETRLTPLKEARSRTPAAVEDGRLDL